MISPVLIGGFVMIAREVFCNQKLSRQSRFTTPKKNTFYGSKNAITLFCGTPSTFGGERENVIIYIPALYSFLPYLFSFYDKNNNIETQVVSTLHAVVAISWSWSFSLSFIRAVVKSAWRSPLSFNLKRHKLSNYLEAKTCTDLSLFCSINAHSLLVLCYFLLFFIGNWFHLLYKGMNLGEINTTVKGFVV